jgi:hypothetical protein
MKTCRLMMRVALMGMLLFVALEAVGQTNVTIRGTVEKGAGKRVLLGGYGDMLTRTEVVLDSAVVAADGTFELRCYANYPRLVFV